jgi:hypothetical protein
MKKSQGLVIRKVGIFSQLKAHSSKLIAQSPIADT